MGKRQQTRARLQNSALDLFERQGFDATTVDQIAAAAGVTAMTFFRHFPAKENVLLDDPYDPMIAAVVAAQPTWLPPLARVARGLRAAVSQLPEPDGDLTRRRVRIAAQTPGLRAAVAASSAKTEDLIAAALNESGVAALPARAAAAAAMAALTTALLEWASQAEITLGEAVNAVLDVLEPRHE